MHYRPTSVLRFIAAALLAVFISPSYADPGFRVQGTMQASMCFATQNDACNSFIPSWESENIGNVVCDPWSCWETVGATLYSTVGSCQFLEDRIKQGTTTESQVFREFYYESCDYVPNQADICAAKSNQEYLGCYADDTTANFEGCEATLGSVASSSDGGVTWCGTWTYTGNEAVTGTSSTTGMGVEDINNPKPATESYNSNTNDLGCDGNNICTEQDINTLTENNGGYTDIQSDGVTITATEHDGITTTTTETVTTVTNPDGSVTQTTETIVSQTSGPTDVITGDATDGTITGSNTSGPTVVNNYTNNTVNTYDSHGNLISSESTSTGESNEPPTGNCAPGEKCVVEVDDSDSNYGTYDGTNQNHLLDAMQGHIDSFGNVVGDAAASGLSLPTTLFNQSFGAGVCPSFELDVGRFGIIDVSGHCDFYDNILHPVLAWFIAITTAIYCFYLLRNSIQKGAYS